MALEQQRGQHYEKSIELCKRAVSLSLASGGKSKSADLVIQSTIALGDALRLSDKLAEAVAQQQSALSRNLLLLLSLNTS